MKKIAITLVVALGLSGSLLVAQEIAKEGRRHPDPAKRIQRHVGFLTNALSLTPAQQQQATTLFTNEAATQKTIHEQMRTAHESLKAAVQKNDSAGIDQAANTIGSLTAQMTSSHARTHAAFLQSLTPDQQTRMTEMESHGRGMRGPRGRGWSGHPFHGGPPPGAPQD